MKKPRVLFICIKNSARSQMAEALFKQRCGEEFDAFSAGFEPGEINPLAVAALSEVGIHIVGKKTQGIFDIYKSGQAMNYTVRVCSEAERSARVCPIFPGLTERFEWDFNDPAACSGNEEAKLARMRAVRDGIKAKIEQWCAEHCHAKDHNKLRATSSGEGNL